MTTATYASPAAIARTPEELLETMTGMFLPPSAMGEVNGLKVLCLQRENTALKAEVERLRNELSDWDYGTRAKREQERAEKAEAESESRRVALVAMIKANNKLEAENARLLEALREIASQEGEWHFGGVPHPLCVIAEKAIQKV
jgi:regulator of replication initiation timing